MEAALLAPKALVKLGLAGWEVAAVLPAGALEPKPNDMAAGCAVAPAELAGAAL